MIRLIAAIDRKRGLSKHGFMPWNIPEDSEYFTEQTKSQGGHVLSGGVTYRTYHGPLVDRTNYVLTRDASPIVGANVVNDLSALLKEFVDKDLWVAGGADVFAQIINLDCPIELYLTLINADFGCDRFFPSYEASYKSAWQSELREQNGFHFTYARYVKKP